MRTVRSLEIASWGYWGYCPPVGTVNVIEGVITPKITVVGIVEEKRTIVGVVGD